MNNCFLITSAIDVDNEYPFWYSMEVPRSVFTKEERLRQTFYSINSIRLVCPESTIYIIDVSKNYEVYQKEFTIFTNVRYVACEQIAPKIAETCRTTHIKGLCESLLTLAFMQHFKTEVSQFDYLIKLSGRYFFTQFDYNILNQENTNKYLIPLYHCEWSEHLKFPDFLKVNDKYYMYPPTQSYAVGNQLLDKFVSSLQLIPMFYIDNPDYAHVDYEALFHYYVIRNEPTVHLTFRIGGWLGTTAEYREV